jgi:hypothetical protein
MREAALVVIGGRDRGPRLLPRRTRGPIRAADGLPVILTVAPVGAMVPRP